MVSRKGDDQPRTPPDRGSEMTRWEKFMASHGGTLAPVGLLLLFVALIVYGMCAPH